MKKLYLLLIVCIVVLAGCGSKSLRFKGESDSWKGEFVANINDDQEQGNFTFGYKDAGDGIQFKDVVVSVNGGDKQLHLEELDKATIKMKTSCDGCFVTQEDETFKVDIQWTEDGQQHEETFVLE